VKYKKGIKIDCDPNALKLGYVHLMYNPTLTEDYIIRPIRWWQFWRWHKLKAYRKQREFEREVRLLLLMAHDKRLEESFLYEEYDD